MITIILPYSPLLVPPFRLVGSISPAALLLTAWGCWIDMAAPPPAASHGPLLTKELPPLTAPTSTRCVPWPPLVGFFASPGAAQEVPVTHSCSRAACPVVSASSSAMPQRTRLYGSAEYMLVQPVGGPWLDTPPRAPGPSCQWLRRAVSYCRNGLTGTSIRTVCTAFRPLHLFQTDTPVTVSAVLLQSRVDSLLSAPTYFS